jgi:hypothetical protein
VPNELFYKSELIASADPFVTSRFLGWDMLPNDRVPMMFIHTCGKDDREGNSPSWFNAIEVMQVQAVIKSLKDMKGVKLKDEAIGVITP